MQRGQPGSRTRDFCLQLCLACLQLVELVLQARRPKTLRDRVDEIDQLAFDRLQFSTGDFAVSRGFGDEPVPFFGVRRDELRDMLGLHQLPAQSFQDVTVQTRAADPSAVSTGPLNGTAAAKVILPHPRIGFAAAATEHLSGEQELGPPVCPKAAGYIPGLPMSWEIHAHRTCRNLAVRDLLRDKTGLNLIPKLRFDHVQLRDRGGDDCVALIGP